MLDIIKKSYEITANNPIILIFWAAYLFILPVCSLVLVNTQGSYLFFLALLIVIMLNSAFFAGWFGTIKKAIKNADKTYENADEKYEDILGLKNVFFESIPAYIFSILGVFAIYFVGYALWLGFAVMIANKFIGHIDFLLENIKNISGSTAATLQYLQELPYEQLKIIYGWQLFLVLAIAIFSILTLFLPPALYFEKNNKKNPLRAFLNSAKTLIKRPLGVIGFSIILQFLFFVLMVAQLLCAFNILFLYFIYLVIFLYVTAFMVVLLFNYYDKRFADNSCNGSDSVG